nr:histidine kinase [uncultured Eisenbergiella sp.]
MKRETGENRKRWRLRDIWLTIGAILLVLWIMFITVSTVTMWALDRQSRESMQGVLDFGSSKLESRLRQIENFLTVTLVSDAKFGMLRNTSLSYVDNLRQVALQMDSYGQYFPDFSGIFFYDSSRDILLDKQWNDISAYSMTFVVRRMEMRGRMRALCSGELQGQAVGEWTIENIDNMWTAFYIYYHHGQYLGVYVALDGLWDRLIDLEEVAGFEDSGLTDLNGLELTKNKGRVFRLEGSSYWEQGKGYLQLTKKIDRFPAVIVTLVPRQQLRGNWMIWWSGLIILAAVSGVFLVHLLLTLQRVLFAPLSELNRQMKAFSEGNLDTHIAKLVGCQEVRELSGTFNEMTGQIHDMKIENYEKRLEKQETFLKYLQIQKNPHFFLNMLNVIYSLAASGNVTQIRTITLELIRHVRYVLSVEKPLVPLLQELEFTHNYLEIQRIRFPYTIRVEEEGFTKEILQILVPPLLLQTFVENAVKYALSLEDMLQIHLEAVLAEDVLTLRISDCGPGFPEAMLEELNASGTVSPDERGEHIGIHNVLSRMRLLYGTAYGYHFANLPGEGAQVELILPQQV